MNRRTWIKLGGMGVTSFLLPTQSVDFLFSKKTIPTKLSAQAFGKDFLWGAACAAYQVVVDS